MVNRYICGFVMALILIISPMAAMAQGAGAGVEGQESRQAAANPPPKPVSPTEGETKPYVYDLATGLQMGYWRQVMIGLANKLNAHPNQVALNNPGNVFAFIAKEKIDITPREAEMLCLMISNEQQKPSAYTADGFPADSKFEIPNWPNPDWPRCGNVLETMFGDGIYAYLSANANDQYRLDVYRELIYSMGLKPGMIEATINKNIEEQGLGQFVALQEVNQYGTDDVCYTAENNIQKVEIQSCGVLCTVSTIIISLLNAASEAIVLATVANPTFVAAIISAMVLYITIYGAMVLLGMAQLTLSDALIRAFKLGVVTMLLTSVDVMTFFHMIRCFFIEGATYLINSVLTVGLEAIVDLGSPTTVPVLDALSQPDAANICSVSLAADSGGSKGPLIVLEAILAQVFSNHMFLTIGTLFLSSIQGFILVLFLLYGLFMFLVTILTAVVLYLSSMIAMYLLLSMMPIFIAFVMFERTKHLFDGWLAQIAANALAPVFLFAYISLFIVVIEAALAQIIDTKICWRKWITLVWIFDIYKYQFVNMTSDEVLIGILPFGFFEVLIFIILVLILKEFEDGVKEIANYVAGEMSGGGGAADRLGRMMRSLPGKARGFAYGAASKGVGAIAGHMKHARINAAHGVALRENAARDASSRSSAINAAHGAALRENAARDIGLQARGRKEARNVYDAAHAENKMYDIHTQALADNSTRDAEIARRTTIDARNARQRELSRQNRSRTGRVKPKGKR